MGKLVSFVAATVGRVVPKYRTLNQFQPVYSEILATRQIGSKTRANRRGYVKRIVEKIGDLAIGSIRPHQVASAISALHAQHPHLAKRTLVEAREMFNEALLAGWIDSNPAELVRALKAPVVRERLSLDQWQRIHDYADCCSPPWVARMMVLALVTGQRRGDIRKMRFSDVWPEGPEGAQKDFLHVTQQKTGSRVAIPLDLCLMNINITVRDAIEACRKYAVLDSDGDGYLIRKTTGGMLAATSMSWRFEQAREGALPPHKGKGSPPSLHECRSLAERLYREIGINTMILLGHAWQSMTDLYNRDRGAAKREGKWKVLEV